MSSSAPDVWSGPDTPDRPIRLTLANDFEVVVRGLAEMLAPYQDRVEVVDIEVDADGAGGPPVDITLFDTFSHGQADGDALDRVLESDDAGQVVVFSWNTQQPLVDQALAKGVSGYLAKSITAEELVAALEKISRGQKVVITGREAGGTDGAGHRMTLEENGDWPGRAEGLTVREAEVVSLITQGMSNDDVAEACYLSINSVKSYIRSAYRKMGVKSRAQAVRWGVEHGMLPDRGRQQRP
jgi:DNA-binding NarL/FixJ family response regulator